MSVSSLPGLRPVSCSHLRASSLNARRTLCIFSFEIPNSDHRYAVLRLLELWYSAGGMVLAHLGYEFDRLMIPESDLQVRLCIDRRCHYVSM